MDYNELRTAVVKCVEGREDSDFFKLNMFKLAKTVKPMGLIPIIYSSSNKSRKVTPDDIPLLAEYFKEEKLNWFDEKKTFLHVIFVRAEDMDEDLQDYLADCYQVRRYEDGISKPCSKDKSFAKDCRRCESRRIDIISTLASIVSSYPCYTAIVAKWVKKDSISFNIRFRANSILINSDAITETDETKDEEKTKK